MPAYDFKCNDCGPFTVVRPMVEYALPMACPGCGTVSPRALLKVPSLAMMGTGQRKAFATNERSVHAPRLASAGAAEAGKSGGAHRAGCSCCAPSKKTQPAAAKSFPAARPWMISH